MRQLGKDKFRIELLEEFPYTSADQVKVLGVNPHAIEGKAAVKSQRMKVGPSCSSPWRWAMWSISATLANMDLFGKKPRWCGWMCFAAMVSHFTRQALATIRFSVLEMANGLVLSVW